MLTVPFGGVFCYGILDENENNEENRYQAMHHQLVASALAVKLAHEIDSNNQIGCMLAYHNGYPYTCLTLKIFYLLNNMANFTIVLLVMFMLEVSILDLLRDSLKKIILILK